MKEGKGEEFSFAVRAVLQLLNLIWDGLSEIVFLMSNQIFLYP